MYDSIIIGGGTAGLSAALVLGRARRRALVIDAGSPRNAPAAAAHGVFTRDGTAPTELLRMAREQLRRYGTVEVLEDRVVSAAKRNDHFDVTTDGGAALTSRTILLAHGVVDELPAVDGLRELWGRSVLHCPYCHGWEVRERPLAYMAEGDSAIEFGCLLKGWTDSLTLCTNAGELTAEQEQRLVVNGVVVKREAVVRVEGGSDGVTVHHADGSGTQAAALFLRPPQRMADDLAARLGCEVAPSGRLVVNPLNETSVPGVYAAGDVAVQFQQVGGAAASGSTAAAGINHRLVWAAFADVNPGD